MKRSQELENAVEDYLKLKGCSYLRIDNYRCFKCGQVQNSKAKGWPDFFVFYPRLYALECKTGKGRLNPTQKGVRIKMEKVGIPFLLVRDTVDELLKIL